MAASPPVDPPEDLPELFREEVRYVMGTLATVRSWSPAGQANDAAVAAAFSGFDLVDSLMSTWREDSALMALNRAPAGQWVVVGHDVTLVLGRALEAAAMSGGAFDPTVLPLVRLWGFRSPRVSVPDSQAIRDCLAKVDYRNVEVDSVGLRARFLAPGMAIDLGGIAKGYALDLAASRMKAAGAVGGYLDLGGNILVFGQQPGQQVGIVDPANPDEILASLPLAAGAVATSGQYERFLVLDGVSYGHIIDPRTGWPVTPGYSVTVLADRAILADALATAAVVLGAGQGHRLLETATGVEGVTVTEAPSGPAVLRATSGLTPGP